MQGVGWVVIRRMPDHAAYALRAKLRGDRRAKCMASIADPQALTALARGRARYQRICRELRAERRADIARMIADGAFAGVRPYHLAAAVAAKLGIARQLAAKDLQSLFGTRYPTKAHGARAANEARRQAKAARLAAASGQNPGTAEPTQEAQAQAPQGPQPESQSAF